MLSVSLSNPLSQTQERGLQAELAAANTALLEAQAAAQAGRVVEEQQRALESRDRQIQKLSSEAAAHEKLAETQVPQTSPTTSKRALKTAKSPTTSKRALKTAKSPTNSERALKTAKSPTHSERALLRAQEV